MDKNITHKIKERLKENIQRESFGCMPDPAGLSNSVNVLDLLNKDGEQFIVDIYQKLLLREPDAQGLETYMDLITKGYSKEFIILSIINSSEAKEKKKENIVQYTGLEVLSKNSIKDRLRRILYLIPGIKSVLSWRYKLNKYPSFYDRINRDVDDKINKKLDELRLDTIRKAREQRTEFDLKFDSLRDETALNTNLLCQDTLKHINLIHAEITQRLDEFCNDNWRQAREDDIEKIKKRISVLENQLKTSVNAFERNIKNLKMKFDLSDRKSDYCCITAPYLNTQDKCLSPTDDIYFDFETEFRGPTEEIKKRLSAYVPYVKSAVQKTKGTFLLDIGCGRGELLDLLSELGVPCKGIDQSVRQVTFCVDKGLPAQVADALEFIKTVPNDSLIGVTAIQVAEHLSPEYLIEMIRASFKKIKGGGLLLLETVNPESLFSLQKFYLDFTHRNPIPSNTLKFLLESTGFKDVQVSYSSPVPEILKFKGFDAMTDRLNEIIYGFQDYAVIGIK